MRDIDLHQYMYLFTPTPGFTLCLVPLHSSIRGTGRASCVLFNFPRPSLIFWTDVIYICWFHNNICLEGNRVSYNNSHRYYSEPASDNFKISGLYQRTKCTLYKMAIRENKLSYLKVTWVRGDYFHQSAIGVSVVYIKHNFGILLTVVSIKELHIRCSSSDGQYFMVIEISIKDKW